MQTRLDAPLRRPTLVFLLSNRSGIAHALAERLDRVNSSYELHVLQSLATFEEHDTKVKPDVVVIDWQSLGDPESRAIISKPGPPVIVIDSEPHNEREEAVGLSGAFAYLPQKPGYLDALAETVERAGRLPALESELRETEVRYATILDDASDGVVVLRDRSFFHVNKSFARTLGYTVDGLVGRSILEIVVDEERDAVEFRLARVALGADPHAVFDIALLGSNGLRCQTRLSCRPAMLNGRRVVVAVAHTVDESGPSLSFPPRAEQREHLSTLGEIAAGVAHDFNNALEVILGRIELVRLRLKAGEDVSTHLSIMEQAARDAEQIVHRVKHFSRPQSRQEWATISVPHLLTDAIDYVRTQLPAGVVLKSRIDTDATLDGDPSQLREVLVNLINNARDAVGSEGVIEIACFERDGFLRITVTDSGPGIPKEIRPRIFDAFFSTKDASNGTGLGLSVSRQILNEHGIRIQVDSAPGSGTRFELTVDGLDSSRSFGPALASRILVVDDDRAIRDLVADMLLEDGYDATVSSSAEEALRLLGSSSFGCLLTDLDLGNDSGWELARNARRLQPALVVGMMTGWSIDLDAATTSARGIDFVLNKPFTSAALKRALRVRLLK